MRKVIAFQKKISRTGKLGFIIVAAVLLMAILAPWISRYDPIQVNLMDRFSPPGEKYLLGTDYFGRDIFSRIVYGTRVSLYVSTVAVIGSSMIIGSFLGLFSGYYGGGWDNIIMRIMDGMMGFPPLLLAIAVAAALGPSASSIIIALAIVYIPRFARVVRSSVISLKEMEFIQSSVALGSSNCRILFLHLLPNCLAPIIVQVSAYFADAIIAEASLSFLGLGPPPPTPTLGNILSDGRNFLRHAWWISFFPGMVLTLFIIGINLLGDELRDKLDPRLRGQ